MHFNSQKNPLETPRHPHTPVTNEGGCPRLCCLLIYGILNAIYCHCQRVEGGCRGWGEHVLLSCLCAVQQQKNGGKRRKEKKTQKNNAKQQKKTLFYAIFIVKNFSNQKQKLTSKLATIAQCSTGEYPVK